MLQGTIELNSALNVRFINGFMPAPGDSFRVLTFNRRVGDFSCLNGLDLRDAHLHLDPNYTTNGLLLVAKTFTNAVPKLRLSRQADQFLVCWPSEYEGYRLLSSTNIVAQVVTNQLNEIFDQIDLKNWSAVSPAGTNHALLTPNEMENRFIMLVKP